MLKVLWVLVLELQQIMLIKEQGALLTQLYKILGWVCYSLYVSLNQIIPIKQEMNKSINANVNTGPILRAIQLTPTTGSRLSRTKALRLSYFEMKSAIGRSSYKTTYFISATTTDIVYCELINRYSLIKNYFVRICAF
jgi:hypothetical protein